MSGTRVAYRPKGIHKPRLTSGFRGFQGLAFNNPAAINTLQANVLVSACANSYAGAKGNHVLLAGSFFNDGTTALPPNNNQPNSSVGDVRATLDLDCVSNTVSIAIGRFITQTLLASLGSGSFVLGAPVTGNNHKLKLSWDPAAHTFSFQVDSAPPIVVDPTVPGGGPPVNITTAVTPAGPANSPLKQLLWGVIVGGAVSPDPTGQTASIDLTVSNVFTAP